MSIYMNYPGIDGEARGVYYRWIELTSVQFGSGRDEGIHDIACTKEQDSSSPKLAREAVESHGGEVTIVFTKGLKPGEMMYLRLTLSNALISNYSIQGSAGSGSATESFTLNFSDIKFENFGDNDPTATGYDANGPVYDLRGL